MCGIAGIWQLDGRKLPLETLVRFTDTIAHRGPDGAGYELLDDECLGLGHRRLSILDLSAAGKQPMFADNGRYCITFNGEIYNFLELRKELSADGAVFRTDTDTEVILYAWQKWGEACFHRFNGMWAIGIWDNQKKELVLSRDRFGVKPLHYTFERGKLFAFASETVAFKKLHGYTHEIDHRNFVYAMQDMATVEAMGYTIYKNVFQLLPGHVMRIGRSTTRAVQHRWWDTFSRKTEVPRSYDEQVEKLYELFKDACRIRMRSDVPVASALSGGVDSSAVYCMLHHLMSAPGNKERISKEWQKAFIAIFPGTEIDEKRFADQVVDYIGVKPVYVEPDYRNLVTDIVTQTRRMDAITNTPVTVVSDIYKAMHENGIVVSMDGHGADELMFGYVNSLREVYYQALLDKDSVFAEDAMNTYLHTLPEAARDVERASLSKRGKEIAEFDARMSARNPVIKALKRIKNAGRRQQVFNGTLRSSSWFQPEGERFLPSLSDQPYNFSGMKRDEMELAMDFHLTDIPYNLRDFDRGAMFNAIEIRMPFMDYRLVSYLFSLPVKSKIGGGYTKRILRDAMKGKMPETIRTRQLKIGLGAPLDSWFNNELRSTLMDALNSDRFRKAPYWNSEAIRNYAETAIRERGGFNYAEAQKLWNVLNGYLLLN